MKIPLVYPKIPDGKNCPLKKCVAFEKFDGTNIHISYNKETNIWSFGTRRDNFTIDENGIKDFLNAHPGLEEVPELIELRLNKLLKTYINNYKRNYNKTIKIFFEFLGDNSFAGQHQYNDNATLILIDVMLDDKLLSPQTLIQDFRHFNLADIIYQGKYSGQLIEDIRCGKYNVNEGAVIKGEINGEVYMMKVKTNAYMEKLKLKFKDKWEDYWE